MSFRAAAVNVDVDSLYLYYRIHGLDDADASNAVWERGVPRFAELFAEVGVPATFFVVGADLDHCAGAREAVRALAEAGHEIGSHSFAHAYDMTRWPIDRIADDLARARAVLSEASGRPVVGFRAPGYTMTPAMFEVLARQGYTYDSSIFPCPPYYLAKAAVMGLMRLRGRRSRSILDRPSIMWQSRLPHRRAGLLELPVTVLPGVRFPFIGTSLVMMGARGYRLARPLLKRASFVNLEFHGIDLCDLEADGIDAELLRQPDLRVPLATKRALFKQVLEDLRDGWTVDTLEALSPRLAPA